MSLTPEDVKEQKFREKFKGYDVDEVDAFLEQVMHALSELTDERDALRRQLEESEGEEPNELLARTLMTAQRAADETLAAAQAEAEQVLADARSRAARTLDEAQQRIESERAALDAESSRVARAAESLTSFRSEYRSRVQAVIAEQLALLERAGELPDVPQPVKDLAAFGQARMVAPDDPAEEHQAASSALGPTTGLLDEGAAEGAGPVPDAGRAGSP